MRKFMRPFTVKIPKESTRLGYPSRKEPVYEFDGLIDYINGHYMNTNELRSIHPDTTHIIISDYNSELESILKRNPSAVIEDGEDMEYLVRNVDNPLMMNHHLEIELQSSYSSSHYSYDDEEGDIYGR